MEIFSPGLMIKVVEALGKGLSKKREKSDVVGDLRFIRFDDDGVLNAIDALVEGRVGAREPLLVLLRDFNDKEWQVADALARLAEDCSDVSRITKDELDLISWRKPRIRSEIQGILNPYGQEGAEVDLEELKRIRIAISDLNDAIDHAEHLLLHGQIGS